MLSPVATEREYQKLLAVLSLPSSGLRRLRGLALFLQRFNAETPANALYVAECLQHLPLLLQSLLPQTCDPAELLSYLELFTSLRNRFPAGSSVSGLDEALDRLRRVAAIVLCYVGATEDAVRVLLLYDEERLKSLELRKALQECHDPRARVRIAHEYLRKKEHDVASTMEEIHADWWRIQTPGAGGVFIPVLENAPAGEDAGGSGGMLRRMYVKYFSRSDDGRDHVHLDSSVSGAEGNLDELASQALRAARTLLRIDGLEEISCGIGFEPKEFLQKGRSGGLALAMLLYCATIRLRGERTQVRIRGDVAVTGDISDNGEILPVDLKGLEEKVGVTFFSPIRTFIVPISQVAAAEEAVERLKRFYPHRGLEIVGVRHLRDAINDLRIVEIRERGRIAYAAQWAWRYRSALVGTAGVLVALGMLLWFSSRNLDRDPALLEYRGEMLLVENKVAHVLKEIPVGTGGVPQMDVEGAPTQTLAVLRDVDGDGKRELIYALRGGSTGTDSIRCIRLESDSVLWTYVFRKSLHFPASDEILDSRFHVRTFLVDDLDGDGRPEVVAIANHLFFPGLVLKIDALTGKEEDFFLNTGQLSSLLALPSSDETGRKRLVVGGTNNAFRQAAVMILDPHFVHGCSPTRGAYVPGGIDAGLEMAYILIPKTIVGNANPIPGRSGGVNQVFLAEKHTDFVARVNDSAFPEGSGTREIIPSLFFTFNAAFDVADITASSDYDGVAEELVKNGVLPHAPDEKYWKSYRKTIRYWDGRAWIETGAMNNLYLQASKRGIISGE